MTKDFAAISRFIAQLVDEGRVGGAGIAIAVDGKPVFQGFAGDARPGVPATDGTLWPLASISKLTATLRSVRYDQPVDPHRVGRQMLDFLQRHIDRIMAFTRGANANRVVHVDYYRLLDEPAAVMLEVHAALGIESPDSVRSAVADWHRRNPKGARGANPYALEQFGLNADAVAEQFSDYMRHFDIPREQQGLLR